MPRPPDPSPRPSELPAVLQRELDRQPVRLIVEYVFRRMGYVSGCWGFFLWCENGRLRRAEAKNAPIRREELDALGSVALDSV